MFVHILLIKRDRLDVGRGTEVIGIVHIVAHRADVQLVAENVLDLLAQNEVNEELAVLRVLAVVHQTHRAGSQDRALLGVNDCDVGTVAGQGNTGLLKGQHNGHLAVGDRFPGGAGAAGQFAVQIVDQLRDDIPALLVLQCQAAEVREDGLDMHHS